MADYKNEQWWIDLQKSLEGFSDDTPKMSDSDLGRWNGCKIGGRKGGANHIESGHISNVGKKFGAINGKSENSKKKAKILGQTIGKYNLLKATKEQKSAGGKIGGKIRASQNDFIDMCKSAGIKSAEKRINEKLEKYKCILKFIRKKEFTFADMRNACIKYGILDRLVSGQAKKILREKSLVKQIHKGYNQYNPSLYIKIKF